MKMFNEFIASVFVLATLSGCATLNQTTKVPTPTEINTPLPDICQEAKNNSVKANSLYTNKGLSINAEVRTVNEGFQPRYRVFLLAGNIAVHAGTENKSNVESLSKGKTVTASGVVTEVSHDYRGCSITLKNATFS